MSSSGAAGHLWSSRGGRATGAPRRRARISLAAFLGVLFLASLGLAGERTSEPPRLGGPDAAYGPYAPGGPYGPYGPYGPGQARGDPLTEASDPLARAADALRSAPVDQRSAAPEQTPTTAVVARVGDLEMHAPAADPVATGFHEASTSAAIELDPVGRITHNHNTTRFEPPQRDPRGSDYLVMASRGRLQAATSAVDIVMHDEAPVLSPVSGTVSDVRTYWLYGEHEDHRIEVVPDDAPHLRVVLVHVVGPQVAAGARVQAGTSVLASGVNRFPFPSQIDREVHPERLGHVHLEIQPVDAPRPGG